MRRSNACSEAILNFRAARDFRFERISHSYMRRDSMRYAHPIAPEQLDFGYERPCHSADSQAGCPATFRGIKELVSVP
jgi:hypothetical protein